MTLQRRRSKPLLGRPKRDDRALDRVERRIVLPPAVGSHGVRRGIVGTLSFPVDSEANPKRDNSDVIAGIILGRRPKLLVCAGSSVLSRRGFPPIAKAAKRAGSVALVETNGRPRISFRIERGKVFCMGRQYFACRDEINEHRKRVSALADAIECRSIRSTSRPAFLLKCGEITVLQGRNRVAFNGAVAKELQDAIRADRVLIVNPTHTRMGNSGTIKAWRKFLSQAGRLYVSSSNWDVEGKRHDGTNRRQKPSATLQSVWHDGRCLKCCFTWPQLPSATVHYVYREWEAPL